MEEITAVFCEERHRWDQTIVGAAQMDVDGETVGISIKGTADVDELHRSATYRFYGRWTNYTNRRTGREERQFVFSTFCLAQPAGREGIIAYLRRAGEGNGIGTARATRLWEIYGSEAVRMLREQPVECAAKVKGLSADKAESAARWLVQMQALEACTIELTDIIAGRGFPQAAVKQAIGKWGNDAARRIRKNPYILMEFPRCGFKLTDNLWLALGLPPGRLLRQALAAWYAVASDNEGHTWYPAEFAIQGIRNVVRGVDLQEIKALKLAFRIGQRSVDSFGALAKLRTDETGAVVENGGKVWVAEGRNARQELNTARMIVRASQEPHQWPSAWEVEDISDHQRAELDKALQGPVAILGGSPGTGKTYTAARLIKKLQEKFGAGQVIAGAFTGRAASRLGETLNRYKVNVPTRTWHSWLKLGLPGERNASNPLTQKVLIGDEKSMDGLALTHSIFSACPAGTHILWLGDTNQLPPIEHGAPLRDMIRAGLPYGELKEIKRNSGGIVEACAAIREGQPWGPGDNFEIIETRSPEQTIREMFAAIDREATNGYDPLWHIQPIVAVNKSGPLSRVHLCNELQMKLSHEPGNQGLLRVADKVVNTKNGWFRVTSEYEHIDGLNDTLETYVPNGELCEVLEIQPNRLLLRGFYPDRHFIVPQGAPSDKEGESRTGCTFELGHALSVHRMQGSDAPVVIVIIDDSNAARMVCDRSWVYTAFSRAAKKLIMIGKKSTADRFCRTQKMDKRKTFLAEQILRLSAQRTLVEL